MNRKLAATAVSAIEILLLLLPAATTALLTRLPVCLPTNLSSCLPRTCLPACLICRAPWGCRRVENTVQQEQPELASRTKMISNFYWCCIRNKSLLSDLLACYKSLDYWAEGGGYSWLLPATGAWSDYCLKFQTLNCAKGEPVKVQVRDIVRVVDFVAPLDPRGSVPGKKSFYHGPGCKWAQETCARCPKQRYATGEPGKVQGRDNVGIV